MRHELDNKACLAVQDEAEAVARSGLVGAVLTALKVHDTPQHAPHVCVPPHLAAGGDGGYQRGGVAARGLHRRVVVPLLRVVGRWAWDHALRAALGANGACERLLHLVSQHADEELSVELALAALHALAWNPENKVRLAEAPVERGMGLVVAALERFPRAQALQLQGISIMSIMSYYSDPNKALLHRCGAVEVLVMSINAHPDHPSLQEQGSLAMWYIAHAHAHTHTLSFSHTPTHTHTHTPTNPHTPTHTHTQEPSDREHPSHALARTPPPAAGSGSAGQGGGDAQALPRQALSLSLALA